MQSRSFRVAIVFILAATPFTPRAAIAAGPVVLVQAQYAGGAGNANEVDQQVTQPIDVCLLGLEKTQFLWSRSAGGGKCCVCISFTERADPRQAQRDVRDHLHILTIPPAVIDPGTTVSLDTRPARILVLRSSDARYDVQYLGNYALLSLVKDLQHLPSTGRVELLGKTQLALHVYVNSEKLSSLALTVSDVKDSLKLELDEQPKNADADIDRVQQIILKTTPGGSVVRLRDVARMQLGGGRAEEFARLNGMPVIALVIRPTGSSLTAAEAAEVERLLASLRARLPQGVALDDFFVRDRLGGEKHSTADYWSVEATFPPGPSPEQIAQRLSKAANDLCAMPGVKSALALSDNPFALFHDGPSILLRLDAAVMGNRDQAMQNIRTRLNSAKDFAVCIRHLSPRGADDDTMDMALVGPKTDVLRKLADKLAERLRKNKDLADFATDGAADLPLLSINFNSKDAARLGVSHHEFVTACLSGEVGCIRKFGQELPVKLEFDPPDRLSRGNLASLKVRGVDGKLIAIDQFAKVTETTTPSRVDRLNGRPMVHLYANPAAGVSPAHAWAVCNAVAADVRKELNLDDKYRLQWIWLRPEPGE